MARLTGNLDETATVASLLPEIFENGQPTDQEQ